MVRCQFGHFIIYIQEIMVTLLYVHRFQTYFAYGTEITLITFNEITLVEWHNQCKIVSKIWELNKGFKCSF